MIRVVGFGVVVDVTTVQRREPCIGWRWCTTQTCYIKTL